MEGDTDLYYNQKFTWQPANPLGDWFELFASSSSRLIATLWISKSVTISAQLDADDRHLSFASDSLSNRRIRISDTTTKTVVANYERRWGRHGKVRFLEGRQLEWRRIGLWYPIHVFTDRFGNPLLGFTLDGAVTYLLGPQREPLVSSWEDLLLLLALGWILLTRTDIAGPYRAVANF